MTTPLYHSTNAEELSAEDGPFARFRVGTLVSFATNQAVVSLGGSTFPAAYIRGTNLLAGDLVYVSNQSGSWVIHGALAGVGTNLLANFNPSFEDSAPGTEPVLWFLANTAGTSTAAVVQTGDAPDGSQVASVGTAGGGATAYLYSSPIAVSTGDMFTVSAFAGGEYQPADTATADVALVGLWFANATNLYPTTSSADTVIVSVNDIVQKPPYTTLSGSVTAPVNGFMRLALRTATVGTQQVYWDQVIVRRTL